MVLPRNSRLYTKKEPSDKFILILEGRALVTIGQVGGRGGARPPSRPR